MLERKSCVLVLASGGIDSSTLIDFYLKRDVEIHCVHFQYGQASAESEKRSFEKICEHYKVEHHIIQISFPMAKRKEELIFRNLLFILAACSVKQPPFRVAIGIHTGTPYYDCTKAFLDDCQRILDGYFSGTVGVEAPFLKHWKSDIIQYAKENKVPLDLHTVV